MEYAQTAVTDYELDAIIRGREPPKYQTIRDETYERYANQTRKILDLCRFQCSDDLVATLSRFACEYRAWESTRESKRQRDVLGDSREILHFRSPRGLMFFGGPGTGKTTLCRIIGKLMQKTVWQIPSVSMAWSRDGWDAVEAFEKNELVILDDLGSESDTKHFGESGVMTQLLSRRYERFVRSGVPTILTTNLIADGIVSRYGERIVSRFSEMFNVIAMDGEDRRMKLGDKPTRANRMRQD